MGINITMVKFCLFLQAPLNLFPSMDLASRFPEHVFPKIELLLQEHPIEIKLVGMRKSKHGDFRRLPNGKVCISVNKTPNPYRFLITFLHEMAHHIAFEKYGYSIAPHGKEWKKCFAHLTLPFLSSDVFPEPLLTKFKKHMLNPKASSDTDLQLALALRQFDPPTHKKPIFTLMEGAHFQLDNGRSFEKGPQQRKRFQCIELTTGKVFLFQPHAEVIEQ